MKRDAHGLACATCPRPRTLNVNNIIWRKEVKMALATLMLSVQDGINVQGGIFHKINKNTGPNKCVQGGIFSKN